jgi:hypothetical protein
MAATSEQNTNENIKSFSENDNQKLAEMFPEEVGGWHG